jgi:hypothetical protein
MRLPDVQMSELLKFALRLNETQRATGDYLTGLPDDMHELLKADRSIFCLTPGSATQLQDLVHRIERVSPPHRRKWSNDSCVVCSYALQMVCRNEIGHAILSVGRNHPSNQIICGMFSRSRKSSVFSIVDFTMSHLAVGYALDSVGLRSGMPSLAIEVKAREKRRLPGGDASLLSGRVDLFLSNRE